MKITKKQIQDKIVKVARTKADHVISTTTEEECDQLTRELARDARKLNTFMKTCFACGFISDGKGVHGKKLGDHFSGALYGAATIAQAIQFHTEINGKN